MRCRRSRSEGYLLFMPRLAKREPQRLWPDCKYDMHVIASGLPVDCLRGEDYGCSDVSFSAFLRRFAGSHDVVYRCRPIVEDDAQVGWRVQFFWNLHRSDGHRAPSDFSYPDDTDALLERCSPYVRPKYAQVPDDLRAPLAL